MTMDPWVHEYYLFVDIKVMKHWNANDFEFAPNKYNIRIKYENQVYQSLKSFTLNTLWKIINEDKKEI